MIDLHELADLVEKMRHAQKQYFRTRSKTWLAQSKRLEKQVDDYLAEYRGGAKRLFDV